MAYIADSNGNLHDDEQLEPECDTSNPVASYETATEALEAQRAETEAAGEGGAPTTIKHFCPHCIGGASWGDLLEADNA